MKVKKAALAALLIFALTGCTVYEGYVVKETRTRPERPVEVAREGEISNFEVIVAEGADLATAILAPLASVAKAAVVSAVDVEVNRSKETRVIKRSRWFTTEKTGFTGFEAACEGFMKNASAKVTRETADEESSK